MDRDLCIKYTRFAKGKKLEDLVMVDGLTLKQADKLLRSEKNFGNFPFCCDTLIRGEMLREGVWRKNLNGEAVAYYISTPLGISESLNTFLYKACLESKQ